MKKQKNHSIVYNANGVPFTIYPTVKQTKSGPKPYWLIEDYSTGKRRLLNNKSLKAARQRADLIRSAMVKGQANRMAMSNGDWQDICVAQEVMRGICTGDSVGSAIRDWATCTGLLGDRASLLDAVKFYLSNHKNGETPPKPTRFVDAAERYHQFKVRAGMSQSRTRWPGFRAWREGAASGI